MVFLYCGGDETLKRGGVSPPWARKQRPTNAEFRYFYPGAITCRVESAIRLKITGSAVAYQDHLWRLLEASKQGNLAGEMNMTIQA